MGANVEFWEIHFHCCAGLASRPLTLLKKLTEDEDHQKPLLNSQHDGHYLDMGTTFNSFANSS